MRRGLGIILAVVLLAGFAAAAADQPLIIGTTDRVTELSFENSWDMWTWHVLRATTGALVKLDETTLLPTGDLASSWEVSADGLVYTFHIRPNRCHMSGSWSHPSPSGSDQHTPSVCVTAIAKLRCCTQ